MATETDLTLSDARTLHVYDTLDDLPAGAEPRLTIFWHHGTPNIGAPPAPLLASSAERGIRWVSHDRPGYGGSSELPNRSIASAAADVASIADALGIARFAAMGHSGGGPHALACAALLPARVIAAVSVSGLAPFTAEGLDWFAGMAPAGSGELRAATEGRAALRTLLEATDFDPEQFTPSDHEMLDGPWGWLGSIAGQALAGGLGGMLDDDLAYVAPWGFDPVALGPSTLLMHGVDDRVVPCSHSEWLARHNPAAELRLSQGDGHISVLGGAESALDWLIERS